MTKKAHLYFLGLVILFALNHAWAGDVVVIAHPLIGKLDTNTIHKIFMGKTVELNGVFITPVNLKSGGLRERFLRIFLQQDDEKYTAYWTVRRYIGKGVPPREFATTAEVINFIQMTPGAIGYIDERNIKPELNVVIR